MRPEIRLKPQDFLVSHETRDPTRKPREAFGQIRHCCYFLLFWVVWKIAMNKTFKVAIWKRLHVSTIFLLVG